MLRELETEPASVRAISQRTGQADPAIWQMLARLEVEGYVRGEWTAWEAPHRHRNYSLTAAGRRAIDHA